MKEYHKIDSVYKRDEKGKFLIGEFSRPEFEYLADKPWLWTEKIDGTNIRVMWHPYRDWGDSRPTGTGNVQFGGKTDNAQIPAKLVKYLQETFTPERFLNACLEDELCLYGEGYGAGIQKGGGYGPDQKFILFDVKIGNWWLTRENVEDIGAKLGIDVVPLYWNEPRSLNLAIELIQNGVDAVSRLNKPESSMTLFSEGIVGTPSVPLFNRKGERVITKVKYKDFK